MPQGTVLGPVLFIIYVNDLPDVLNESDSNMYADDTRVSNIVSPGQCSLALSLTTIKLDWWSDIWQLCLALSKCYAICFGYGRNDIAYPTKCDIISQVHDVVDLGITLTSDMKPSMYCDKICRKGCKFGYCYGKTKNPSHGVIY